MVSTNLENLELKKGNKMNETEVDYEYCEELLGSVRGKYIIAKALYLAHEWLDEELDDRKRQPSDMHDMLCLLQAGYPNFYGTFLECKRRGIQV